jgi:predicted nucleic acid-binding protein
VIDFPSSCVVDASVGIKLFLHEEHSQRAQELFERSLRDPDGNLFVPDLFFIECANVLWKKVRRGEYTTELAAQSLADLQALELPSTPTSKLMEHALEIACTYGITSYDACYVALAEAKGVPLVTADDRLKRVLAGFSSGVLILSDL